MRMDDGRESDNVEDRRDDSSGSGGGGGMRFGGGGIGIGSIAIALVASYFLGINPMTVLSILSGGGGGGAPVVQQQHQGPAHAPPKDDKQARFVSMVLADTEDVWRAQFAKSGKQYPEPKLVLFRGSTPTACGSGQAAMGPFYCPGDQKIYIDLSFYHDSNGLLAALQQLEPPRDVSHDTWSSSSESVTSVALS